MRRLTLVLADDHPIVLDGLERLFELEPDFEIVARCREGEEALRAVRELRPRLVILDVRMPGLGGLEVLAAMAAERLPGRAVLLAAALDERQLAEAIRLGARGVLLKESAPERLLEAVRRVAAGGEWFDPAVSGAVLRGALARGAAADGSAQLTPRETEIVRMVGSGLRNRAIAQRLAIGEGTVKIHLHNIYEKLAVDGRVALILRAQKLGIV
jgi:DNA-binding NarL/FixJ family response regulator